MHARNSPVGGATQVIEFGPFALASVPIRHLHAASIGGAWLGMRHPMEVTRFRCKIS